MTRPSRAACRAPPSAATTRRHAVGPARPGGIEHRAVGDVAIGEDERAAAARRGRGRRAAAHPLTGGTVARCPSTHAGDRRRDLRGAGRDQLIGIAEDRHDPDRAHTDGAGHLHVGRCVADVGDLGRAGPRDRAARAPCEAAPGPACGPPCRRRRRASRAGRRGRCCSSCGTTISRWPAVTIPSREPASRSRSRAAATPSKAATSVPLS